jgi:drug/metabolite transporter (DMT)-like permease
MSRSKNSYLPFLLLFIQPIFMASNLIVARGGVEHVPPISLAFWRWVLVFFILLPFTFNSLKKNFKFIKQEYKQLFFIGAMGCGVCGAFPFLAGQTTTITNMGIIYTSSPIFIILISSIFFKEKINFLKIIGLCSCLIGVFIIIIKGNLSALINLKFTVGDLWMLAAAVGWALYSIYLFYWKTYLKIFQRFTLIAFFGFISLLPFYLIEEVFFVETTFNTYFFLWVSFAAISPGIIAFTLYTLTQRKLGASITGFTLYIFTVYGAIYGILLFDENLENYHYIGTILVFSGVYLVKKKRKYEKKN